MDKLLDMGIDGWKVDQAEQRLGAKVLTSLGTINKSDFKYYYYAAIADHTLKRNSQGIILARPFSHQGGFAACVDKCIVGWGGDYSGNWNGIEKQLRDLYISARNSYAALCVEVGGYFKARPTKLQLIRTPNSEL